MDLNVLKGTKRGRPALASKALNLENKENQPATLSVKRGRSLSFKIISLNFLKLK